MKITLPLDIDSDNSAPGDMTIRRGNMRPHNLVIEVDQRELEVDMKNMRNSLALLSGKGFDLSLSEQLRKLQQKARGAAEWDAINRALKIAEREEDQ